MTTNKDKQLHYLQTLKVYQIKDIMRLYFDEEHPELKVKYKSKSKKDLINLINIHKIKLYKYAGKFINETPTKKIDLLKKYGSKAYDAEQQTKYLEDEELYKKEYLTDAENTQSVALVARKNKKGGENVSLQKHQIDFIKQFIYSNLNGAIMFHGVGSGKTLTAVVSAYWYLQIYPNNKVLVISPSALLYNFLEGMQQFGLDISDNRYSFITYEKYSRLSTKNKIATDTLLIVDEAHNLRTEMHVSNLVDPDDPEKVIGKTSKQNKRGFNIFEYGAMNCHKIILLTGTAFVNGIYDVENLLAMIDKRPPLDKITFTNVLSSPSNITDYFSYRISYYKSPESIYFPRVEEELIPLYMTESMEKKYSPAQQRQLDAKNAFFIDERKASNYVSDTGINPKIVWCIDKILEEKTKKFIIYTGLFSNGIELLELVLKKNKVDYVRITGKETATQKERNKTLYNMYDPKNPIDDFKYRILLISRAGAEGVDTRNTNYIVLLDHQWNDALSQQIIARAVRYKSHWFLPKDDQVVKVVRLFLCSSGDEELFKRVNSKNVNYVLLNREIKEETRKANEMLKKENEAYLPTVKLVKSLKKGDTDEPFVPLETEKISKRIGWNSKLKQDIYDYGWDHYYKETDVKKKKEWLVEKYSAWFVAYSPDRGKPITISSSVDLRLYVLCQAKLANITTFISYFSNIIKTFEEFESSFIKTIESEEKINGGVLTEKQRNVFRKI